MNTFLIKKEISEIFEDFYKKGYITARDGNACVKIKDGLYLITASGVRKDKLNEFIYVNDYGTKVDLFKGHGPINDVSEDRGKPSIETMTHLKALIGSNKSASIHVHSPKTVALFKACEMVGKTRELESDLTTQWPELFRYTRLGGTVGLWPPGSKELHEGVERSFKPGEVDICVLQGHGVVATGNNLQDCVDHIVRLEHICAIVLDISGSL